MRRYLLDTGVLIHYGRQSQLYKDIEANEKLSAPDCMPLISVVTHGEILSFGMQQNWGNKKLQLISSLLSKLIIIDINSGDVSLIKSYAEMDAYSKNKLPGRPLGSSSIKMGKNDLWIAATAKAANATLITTDTDFEHLNGEFIKVIRY